MPFNFTSWYQTAIAQNSEGGGYLTPTEVDELSREITEEGISQNLEETINASEITSTCDTYYTAQLKTQSFCHTSIISNAINTAKKSAPQLEPSQELHNQIKHLSASGRFELYRGSGPIEVSFSGGPLKIVISGENDVSKSGPELYFSVYQDNKYVRVADETLLAIQNRYNQWAKKNRAPLISESISLAPDYTQETFNQTQWTQIRNFWSGNYSNYLSTDKAEEVFVLNKAQKLSENMLMLLDPDYYYDLKNQFDQLKVQYPSLDLADKYPLPSFEEALKQSYQYNLRSGDAILADFYQRTFDLGISAGFPEQQVSQEVHTRLFLDKLSLFKVDDRIPHIDNFKTFLSTLKTLPNSGMKQAVNYSEFCQAIDSFLVYLERLNDSSPTLSKGIYQEEIEMIKEIRNYLTQ